MAKADVARAWSTIRCAIYTRKSSDEGLEQEFNSLDAQREACEAYIVSQRHAGWIALSDMYDDGGLSGGTMERPALKRLLEDIQAGKVQIVVVYKVDRLTRSLADFAKIVDIFDAHNASFVSVTQQFNTTTSMGRLTLNMLLSFAQFEREIAGERIRDKIAASKRKGMWMGGNVPLSYDVKDRKLIVNEPEAATVRLIFKRYAELGSVALLRAELDRQDIVSKRHEGACRQSAQAGRQDRWPRGSTYLGSGLDPSSARPLRRAGRRSLIRWDTMGRGAAELLSRHQTTLPVVPASVSRTFAGGLRRQDAGILHQPDASRRSKRIRRPCSSHASHRLAGLRQEAVRRTRPGSRLSRPLHPSCRNRQQPHQSSR